MKYTWNSGKDASVARAPDMTMSQFDLINFSAETSFTYRKDGEHFNRTIFFSGWLRVFKSFSGTDHIRK